MSSLLAQRFSDDFERLLIGVREYELGSVDCCASGLHWLFEPRATRARLILGFAFASQSSEEAAKESSEPASPLSLSLLPDELGPLLESSEPSSPFDFRPPIASESLSSLATAALALVLCSEHG